LRILTPVPADVLDCGGKRSATPLSHYRPSPKALSPLRSASAVQKARTFPFVFLVYFVVKKHVHHPHRH
jgi:hypothetical protein